MGHLCAFCPKLQQKEKKKTEELSQIDGLYLSQGKKGRSTTTTQHRTSQTLGGVVGEAPTSMEQSATTRGRGHGEYALTKIQLTGGWSIAINIVQIG